MELKLIFLGVPVSVNQTYKTRWGQSGMYVDNKVKQYGEEVYWQAKSQYKKKPLDELLEASYYYFYKDQRRRDHLNSNKILNDKLNKVVWEDDSQIVISHHYTLYDKNNPRIELIIKTI